MEVFCTVVNLTWPVCGFVNERLVTYCLGNLYLYSVQETVLTHGLWWLNLYFLPCYCPLANVVSI